MLNSELPSHWKAPDHLPDFGQEKPFTPSINFVDLERVQRLADGCDVSTLTLVQRITALGLIVAQSELNPEASIWEIDSKIGQRKKLTLQPEKLAPVRQFRFGFVTIIKDARTFSISIGSVDSGRNIKVPGGLTEELVLIANRHHTSVENVWAAMWILGLQVGESEASGEKGYVTMLDEEETETSFVFYQSSEEE